MATVSHYDAQDMIDIFGATQGRDLGGVATDIESIVNQNRSQLAARIADFYSRAD